MIELMEERKYTLKMTREELDGLISFLELPTTVTGADKERLDPIIREIKIRLERTRDLTMIRSD